MRDDDDRNDDFSDRDGDEETGIEISTGFFPMGWVLLFCTPRISINGRTRRRPWGTYFIPLRPGRYEVEVWVPYLFFEKFGANSRRVEVDRGETTRVSYYLWGFF